MDPMFVLMGGIIVVGITMLAAVGDSKISNMDDEVPIIPPKEPEKSMKVKIKEHPLYRIKSLAANFSRHIQDFEKRIHDKPLLEKIIGAADQAQSNLRDIPVEKLLELIEPFDMSLKSYGLELEAHFQNLHEEVVCLTNTLASNPERVFILRDYTQVFQGLDKKILGMKAQYAKNLPNRISTEKVYSIMQSGKNAAVHENKARVELEGVWGFFFSLNTFTLFGDVSKVRLGEISNEIQALQECLEQAKQNLDEEILKKTEYHQHRLEDFLEKNYTFHYKLFYSICKFLQTTQELKTVRFGEEEDTKDNLSYLQTEILPNCAKFSVPQREGLSELRRYFDKFKRSYKGPHGESKLSVGLTESLKVYLESRLVDSRTLVNSELPQQILQTIQLLFADEVRDDSIPGD
ncbi:hypothetical protein HOF92_13240 [bacterium]|jgi:hypothetical protein|nr:hypothetical protein [bacterium]